VRYSWGPYWRFNYVYPYYHRKYIFVSLGGYWPRYYRYRRYYWYGYHPYSWYGYYPVARQVEENNHYYYTYNYYNTDNGSESGNYYDIDENEYSEVKQRLDEKNNTEPSEQTPADIYFEEAVKAFEVNDFDAAAVSFAKAAELDKDDIILPFAYTQAKFAAGEYSEAARALREALRFIDEDMKTVFFPRGLYRNDQILFEQINSLVDMIDQFPFDADLQLLLGYQLIGVGEYEDASEPLNQARLDMVNSKAAIKLTEILEEAKAKAEQQENKI